MSHPKNIPLEVSKEKDHLISYLASLGLDVEKISNFELLFTSFIHKSYAADFRENYPHNERLEFLGDALLEAVIAKKLFLDFPEMPEANLTLYKIWLVREETLAKISKKIWLSEKIFISNWEEKNHWREKSSIISDALEALIWFIFLELGYEEAEKFITQHLYPEIKNLQQKPVKSYKSLSQELVQKQYKILPNYTHEIAEQDQKGNITLYKSEFWIDEKCQSIGYGTNKKKAEENAAKNYYEQQKDQLI